MTAARFLLCVWGGGEAELIFIAGVRSVNGCYVISGQLLVLGKAKLIFPSRSKG